jgi:hypothetical protein
MNQEQPMYIIVFLPVAKSRLLHVYLRTILKASFRERIEPLHEFDYRQK